MKRPALLLSAVLLLLGGAIPVRAAGTKPAGKLEVTFYYLPG